MKVKSLSHVRLFATPWTSDSSVHGLSRQEYWKSTLGLPLPSPIFQIEEDVKLIGIRIHSFVQTLFIESIACLVQDEGFSNSGPLTLPSQDPRDDRIE